MSIRIPVIVDYNGKDLQRLKREFAQIEGAAAKMKFGIQKAALPAAAAITALAGASMFAVNAALEDQAAQEQLARTIKATTGATEGQIKANEKWIETTSKTLGIADDELRPAFAKLVRVTKDVTKSQTLLSLAMDVSRGTGRDLNTVVEAFSKALGGNMKSLRALSPELGGLIKSGADADTVFGQLAATFGGDAAAYTETAAGKLAVMRVRIDELKESFGSALLPILEKYVLPALQRFTSWAEKNPGQLQLVIAAVGSLAAAVVILNVAMAANPWVLLTAGLILLIGYLEKAIGLVTALKDAFEKIRPGITDVLRERATRPYNGGGLGIGGIGGRRIEGGGAGLGIGSLTPASAMSSGGTVVNVNVSGGDPRAVVDKIVQWSRQNGVLPPQILTAA